MVILNALVFKLKLLAIFFKLVLTVFEPLKNDSLAVGNRN